MNMSMNFTKGGEQHDRLSTMPYCNPPRVLMRKKDVMSPWLFRWSIRVVNTQVVVFCILLLDFANFIIFTDHDLTTNMSIGTPGMDVVTPVAAFGRLRARGTHRLISSPENSNRHGRNCEDQAIEFIEGLWRGVWGLLPGNSFSDHDDVEWKPEPRTMECSGLIFSWPIPASYTTQPDPDWVCGVVRESEEMRKRNFEEKKARLRSAAERDLKKTEVEWKHFFGTTKKRDMVRCATSKPPTQPSIEYIEKKIAQLESWKSETQELYNQVEADGGILKIEREVADREYEYRRLGDEEIERVHRARLMDIVAAGRLRTLRYKRDEAKQQWSAAKQVALRKCATLLTQLPRNLVCSYDGLPYCKTQLTCYFRAMSELKWQVVRHEVICSHLAQWKFKERECIESETPSQSFWKACRDAICFYRG